MIHRQTAMLEPLQPKSQLLQTQKPHQTQRFPTDLAKLIEEVEETSKMQTKAPKTVISPRNRSQPFSKNQTQHNHHPHHPNPHPQHHPPPTVPQHKRPTNPS